MGYISSLGAEGDFVALNPEAPRLFEKVLAELGRDIKGDST